MVGNLNVVLTFPSFHSYTASSVPTKVVWNPSCANTDAEKSESSSISSSSSALLPLLSLWPLPFA